MASLSRLPCQADAAATLVVFGIVEGRVSSVSLVPLEGNYRVEIAFPDGLTTHYGICLPVMQEMKATAGIVTEELRLIERLFQPLRKILRGGL